MGIKLSFKSKGTAEKKKKEDRNYNSLVVKKKKWTFNLFIFFLSFEIVWESKSFFNYKKFN